MTLRSVKRKLLAVFLIVFGVTLMYLALTSQDKYDSVSSGKLRLTGEGGLLIEAKVATID